MAGAIGLTVVWLAQAQGEGANPGRCSGRGRKGVLG